MIYSFDYFIKMLSLVDKFPTLKGGMQLLKSI